LLGKNSKFGKKSPASSLVVEQGESPRGGNWGKRKKFGSGEKKHSLGEGVDRRAGPREKGLVR